MTVTVEQAKLQLEQLIDRLSMGESVVITRGGKPVATLSPAMNGATPVRDAEGGSASGAARPEPRKPGSAKGLIHISDDFDAPLEEFREYME